MKQPFSTSRQLKRLTWISSQVIQTKMENNC